MDYRITANYKEKFKRIEAYENKPKIILGFNLENMKKNYLLKSSILRTEQRGHWSN